MRFQDFLMEEVESSTKNARADKVRAKLAKAKADLKDMSVTPHSEEAADAIDDARQEVKRLEKELASLTESAEVECWYATMGDYDVHHPERHKSMGPFSTKEKADAACASCGDGKYYNVHRSKCSPSQLVEGDSGEWCLVMANGKVTGNTCSSKDAATALQKKAPVATKIKYGKRAADGTFVAVKSPLTEVSGYDAKAAYANHMEEFNKNLNTLRGLVRHHGIRQSGSGSWAFVGDLAEANERLSELIEFFNGKEA